MKGWLIVDNVVEMEELISLLVLNGSFVAGTHDIR